MRNLVLLDLVLQPLVLDTLPPAGGEFVGRPGCLVLESRAHDTLQRARHGSQEVRSSLPWGAVETQVNEVLSCFAGGTEEDLTALVKNDGLVKQIVGSLWGLVDGDARSAAEELGLQPEGLAELDSVCRIKTSGRVIPALQRRSGERCLRDGHPLPLSTGNTADVLVPDTSVDGVRNTKHGHDDISDVVGEQVLGYAAWQLAGRTRSRCEGQGVADGQHGEVNVNFGGVNRLTPMLLVHFTCGHTCWMLLV